MSRMSLWDRRKNDDFTFIDEQIRELFEIGGVEVLLHKYIGIHDQGEKGDATQPSAAKSKRKGIKQIQDLFFLENRDRNYDPNVYSLRTSYNIQDTEFSLSQFAMFIDTDSIYLEFHINDMLDKVGRKLLSGDVLEFMHMRDDAVLDDGPAINKYYVVDDVARASSGWSMLWRPHIMRVKVKAMKDSQEFNDILNKEVEGTTSSLRDLISDFRDSIMVSDAIIEQAESDVPLRNFETAHFYVVPGDEDGTQYPWIFAGDGEPPNGAVLAGSGTSFPEDPQDGDWFLHTGMEPNVLYKREGATWIRKEVDLRKKWSAAHRILHSFINNQNITTLENGTTLPEKQPLSRVIKPQADL
jgi:hypothetical protein